MKEILLDHIRNLSETKTADKKMTQVQKTKRKSAKVNVILFSIHSVYTLQTTKYVRTTYLLINNRRMFNVVTDDLAEKPYIQHKSLLQ